MDMFLECMDLAEDLENRFEPFRKRTELFTVWERLSSRRDATTALEKAQNSLRCWQIPRVYMLAGKWVVNTMDLNVGHVHHSVERKKQNVHVFWNTGGRGLSRFTTRGQSPWTQCRAGR